MPSARTAARLSFPKKTTRCSVPAAPRLITGIVLPRTGAAPCSVAAPPRRRNQNCGLPAARSLLLVALEPVTRSPKQCRPDKPCLLRRSQPCGIPAPFAPRLLLRLRQVPPPRRPLYQFHVLEYPACSLLHSPCLS